MSDEFRKQWDERHAQATDPIRPAEVLLRNQHLISDRGKALDLACGLGANALELAENGFEAHAWDFSPVAIDCLVAEAHERGLSARLYYEVRDVAAQPPEPESFDLIIVSYFLERNLLPHLVKALRPGGLLFYQTFIKEVMLERGPKSTEWRLANNELLHAFSDLRVHYYLEEGYLGEDSSEDADIAMLVASKPN